MINPQLLNYVRAQRQAGVPKEEIIKALSGGGWSAQDAQEAFAALEGVQVPPAGPKPPPPPPITPPVTPAPVQTSTPPPQPRPLQPVMQQPYPTPPMQANVRMQPQPVVQRQPVYAQVQKRRRVWPWMLLLFLFLVGGFAGGAYMAVENPVVRGLVIEIKSMISPPTLMPVPAEEVPQNQLPSFMPDVPTLGTPSTTPSTTTASTTTN